ncbi:MAG TPA: hypothetical protein VFC01_10210, partial [Mycobacterium sp.]|nr:hypothetical protein [Mycobacterium sp.]
MVPVDEESPLDDLSDVEAVVPAVESLDESPDDMVAVVESLVSVPPSSPSREVEPSTVSGCVVPWSSEDCWLESALASPTSSWWMIAVCAETAVVSEFHVMTFAPTLASIGAATLALAAT